MILSSLKNRFGIGLKTETCLVLQIIRRVLIRHEAIFCDLDRHEIAAPNIIGFREVGIANPFCFQDFGDVLAQDGAFLRQKVGEKDGVGLVVGDHLFSVGLNLL